MVKVNGQGFHRAVVTGHHWVDPAGTRCTYRVELCAYKLDGRFYIAPLALPRTYVVCSLFMLTPRLNFNLMRT